MLNILHVIGVVILLMNAIEQNTDEQGHEISNSVVLATSKASDQHAHTRSLIRAFARRLNLLGLLSY